MSVGDAAVQRARALTIKAVSFHVVMLEAHAARGCNLELGRLFQNLGTERKVNEPVRLGKHRVKRLAFQLPGIHPYIQDG